jgi:uncharacterized protein YjiS (DUF1127 family)
MSEITASHVDLRRHAGHLRLRAEPTRDLALQLVWRWIASGVKGWAAARTARRRLRHAERQLQSLDDRILDDIGVKRGDIGWVARQGRRI